MIEANQPNQSKTVILRQRSAEWPPDDRPRIQYAEAVVICLDAPEYWITRVRG